MKIIKYTMALSALSGVASAQGLFDVAPNDIEEEDSPLRYTLAASLGYDDNINPTSGRAIEKSLYAQATLGANFVTRGPRTSWDVNASVGQTRYFDANSNQDATSSRVAFNIAHNVSDRLRLVSRNFVNYGLDLGSFYGSLTPREAQDYLYVSTDNAFGYRWTDRLGTYTGVTYSMLDYESSRADVDSFGLYNTFRYAISLKTLMTASYRYRDSSYSFGPDRSTQTASVGIETKLSDKETLQAEVGAQFSRGKSPYGQISYVKVMTDKLRTRAFARYSLEDTDTVFGAVRFNNNEAFRVGFATDYTLSPTVVLTAGGNYRVSEYSEGSTPAAVDSENQFVTLYTGATYKVNEAVSVRSSINYSSSDASGSIPNRVFNRLRYELGLNYTF